MVEIAFVIPLLPLLSFVLITFWGRHLPGKGSLVAIAAIGWGLVHSLCLFSQMLLTENWAPEDVPLYDFFKLSENGAPIIEIAYRLDGLSTVMLVVVTLVSTLVHVYSLGYMGYNTPEEDSRFSRFFAALSLFSFSMLVLVMANNFAVVFIAWELVGFCSYLLIGHWFEKDYPDPNQITPRQAAVKAFLTTKVGDLGFVIGLIGLFALCAMAKPDMPTFNFDDVFKTIRIGVTSGTIPMWALTAVGLCIFFGAVGKSAQFPLHTWLPDAMEGPTPVSALIHAATMVAAGVYLVGRIFPLLTPDAGLIIAYVGGFTALFAASIALVRNDIKAVLAYSTISQLGYMILALGVGAADVTGQSHGYQAGLMHLTTHAMFKACLFLCSGSVIYAMHHAFHHIHSHDDPQDMRNMGGLYSRKGISGFFATILLLPLFPILILFSPSYRETWDEAKLPVTFWTMVVATVAISGVPLFSGFISKDAILGGTLYFVSQAPQHLLLVIFGFGAAAMTAFYMFRLIYMTFFGEPKMSEEAYHHVPESPKVMTVPLCILAVLSFFFAFSYDPTGLWSHGWFFHNVQEPMRVAVESGGGHADSRIKPAESFSLLASAMASTEEEVKGGNESEGHEQESSMAAPGEEVHGGAQGIHIIAALISICIAFGGIAMARKWYGLQHGEPGRKMAEKHPKLYEALDRKWYMDEIYEAVFIRNTLRTSRGSFEFDMAVIDWFVNISATVTVLISRIKGAFDNYIVDGLVDAIGFVVKLWGDIVRRLQTGLVQSYLVYITVAAAIMVIVTQMF